MAASLRTSLRYNGAVGITQRDEDDDADSLTEQPKALPQAKQQQQKEKPKVILINHMTKP